MFRPIGKPKAKSALPWYSSRRAITVPSASDTHTLKSATVETKADVPAGALFIQLGGPGMLIGMGGGSASSMATGSNTAVGVGAMYTNTTGTANTAIGTSTLQLNTTGANRVSHLKNGNVETYDLNAQDLGLAQSTIQDLRGGTPDESAEMMRKILSGNLKGARRDAILLNTAAALAAETGDFKSALAEAQASLDNGNALNKLNALIEFTQQFQTIQ